MRRNYNRIAGNDGRKKQTNNLLSSERKRKSMTIEDMRVIRPPERVLL